MSIPKYGLIEAIRTVRTEQHLGYDEAAAKVVAVFRSKGWDIPEFFERRYPVKKEKRK
jgi:hypothetical protein